MGALDTRGLAILVDRLMPGPGSTLDSASAQLQRSIGRIRNIRVGSMLVKILRGNEWLGHPAHPIAVTLPIGGWAVAAFFDIRSLPGGVLA